MNEAKVVKVSGPLVQVSGLNGAKMFDVVRVGSQQIVGEIIEMHNGIASIQVYEDTSGIGVGDEAVCTFEPLSVELAPGIVGAIFDGIERPLDKIAQSCGDRIVRGFQISSLDRTKLWHFCPTCKVGDLLCAGDELGFVDETPAIKHKILVPFGKSGVVAKIEEGDFNIVSTIAVLKNGNETTNIQMLSKWPVRVARPIKQKLVPTAPLLTGQRVIDTLFPIAKGGVAAVPGPFGSGKTVVQHQIAKWAEADLIVYVGCGERGNEMTDVLNEFPNLKDPKTNHLLINRTVLVANTSDMPVSAREASIYTGITIAEYFRDMGYDVAIMADSTSRWAEALRELSARLEEMPGEEGYPAYLSSRLADFYERAGVAKTLGSKSKIGSITAIGAVSPPGGDLSEPVSQATLRIVKVFWGLSSSLAHKRHFPAIDWLQSYSQYTPVLNEWFDQNVSENFKNLRNFFVSLLGKESNLLEIVRLVGSESLSASDRLVLETARIFREDFLHQNAFDEKDTHTSIKKQLKMLELVSNFFEIANSLVERGVDVGKILGSGIKKIFADMKFVSEKKLGVFEDLFEQAKTILFALEVFEEGKL